MSVVAMCGDGDSVTSNSVRVTCPHKPQQPRVTQDMNADRGHINISWNHGDDTITVYR